MVSTIPQLLYHQRHSPGIAYTEGSVAPKAGWDVVAKKKSRLARNRISVVSKYIADHWLMNTSLDETHRILLKFLP
jgi:hypothetical protein